MAEKRKVAAEARATKEAEKQARAAAKEEAKQQQLRQREQFIRSIKSLKASKKQAKGLIREAELQKVEVVVTAILRGKQVQKPRRFYI